MASVSLVVIVESLRSIVAKEGDDLRAFHLPSIIAVAVALGKCSISTETHTPFSPSSTIVVKFILFVYSYSIRKSSSQVQVLWEDHRNDLWINTFGKTFSYIAGATYQRVLKVF